LPGAGGRCEGEVKLKRAAYRHIEAEIYAYYDTLQAIEELRQDIILAGGRQEAYGAVVGGRYAGTSIVEKEPRSWPTACSLPGETWAKIRVLKIQEQEREWL
jgi:hypothetical protein